MSVQVTIQGGKNPFKIDMRKVGEVAVRSIQERTARGVNSQDQPAKPLAPSYAKAKIRAGAAPIRDLRFTGATMNSFCVLEATADHVVVGFRNATAELRAKRDEAIESMIQPSPRDQQIIKRAMQSNIS